MKRGDNVVRSFESLSHFEVIEHCRPYAAKAGLVLLPSVKSWSRHGNSTIVELTTDVINADDPADRLTFTALGEANDNGDKGVGIATSYAKKFAYVLALELSMGEPDSEERDIPRAESPVQGAPLQSQQSPAAFQQSAVQTVPYQQPFQQPSAHPMGKTYSLNLIGAEQIISELDVVNRCVQAIQSCGTVEQVDALIERNQVELKRVWDDSKHNGYAISEAAGIRKDKINQQAKVAA